MLADEEKELRDRLARGLADAAEATGMIAFVRAAAGGDDVAGARGEAYDPVSTSITVGNVDRYFRHSWKNEGSRVPALFQALSDAFRELESSEASAA